MDKITFQGATKMMHSAVFGQLIIIIVFIPILSLVNVEGKMFRPMALVFCFALLGAMLLCFTYVPVMASLFLKPSDPEKKNHFHPADPVPGSAVPAYDCLGAAQKSLGAERWPLLPVSAGGPAI